MDTYMYASFSVMAFVEHDSGGTVQMLFKWLRAGWAGINVVKTEHMHEGMDRMDKAFRSLLENPALPPAEQVARRMEYIQALPEEDLYRYIREYSNAFEAAAKDVESMDKSSFQDIIENGRYYEVLDPEYQTCVLMKEYLKKALGKPYLVDITFPEDIDPEPVAEPAPQSAPDANATAPGPDAAAG
jgi:hypothetical protein